MCILRYCVLRVTQVLALLQVLGRGNYFDGMLKMGGMSEPTAQRMFHVFSHHISRTCYKKVVPFPKVTTYRRSCKTTMSWGMPWGNGLDIRYRHPLRSGAPLFALFIPGQWRITDTHISTHCGSFLALPRSYQGFPRCRQPQDHRGIRQLH